MAFVFIGWKNYKKLDLISSWFKLAADYIRTPSQQYCFVSTNSICQGEQTSLLWPYILNKNLKIKFAYQSFHWKNSAKNNAGVTCIIVGIANIEDSETRYIYNNNNIVSTTNINPYLIKGDNIFVYARTKPLSPLPIMIRGSQPTDNGNLILHGSIQQSCFTFSIFENDVV